MGYVVPVRVAAERLNVDRRHLSRLLHRGDLPTAEWRGRAGGRWVDVPAPQLARDARSAARDVAVAASDHRDALLALRILCGTRRTNIGSPYRP